MGPLHVTALFRDLVVSARLREGSKTRRNLNPWSLAVHVFCRFPVLLRNSGQG